MKTRHGLFHFFLGLTLSLTACTGSSDKFSKILGDSGGGEGTASVTISSFSPASSSVVIKSTDTSEQFLVSASGTGTLLYKWTLNGVDIGTDAPSYDFNASAQTIGTKTLKVTISDERGSTSREWTVKVNGTPVLSSPSPSVSSVQIRRSVSQSFSVSATDPNSDTLTYVWKLDGQENVLTSTTGTQAYTPSDSEVGAHTVSVEVYDGPSSDAGTFKVTQSWTVNVNHFPTACNTMENSSQTNKSCVFVGIAGIGDGIDPETYPTSFYIRPVALQTTADNNLFIADDMNHVIWFYNKYTSPAVTMFGITVPLNTMKVVAGIGMASAGNTSSTLATRFPINSPNGILWDGTNLFVADTSNSRVIKINSSGNVSTILSAGCSSPRGMTLVGAELFVACFSSNTVVQVNVNTLVSSTFAGTGAAGNPATTNQSTFTDATDGVLNGPYGITSDASGNIYLSEYTGCRVRMYNRTAGAVTLYGSWAISASRQRIILGTSGAPSCSSVNGEPVNLTATADARINAPRLLYSDPGGLLLISSDGDVVYGLNMAAGSTALLGVSITGYTAQTMLGSGVAGYLEGGTPATARFNNPFDIAKDTTTGNYYVADYSNNRLRRFKASNNLTELVAGNGNQARSTNAGQGLVESGQEKMNSIRGLAYDSITKELFVADSSNHRIRVINKFGQVQQAAGIGTTGFGTEEDEYPSNVTMNGPRGLTLTHSTGTFGGHLVWADTGNHRIRILNRSTSSQTLFGVTVSAGKVATIGGNGTVGNLTSGSALTAAFNNPSGVAFDGTNLYVADSSNHCIKKIDSSGTLSAISGTCGTAGNVNGSVGVGQMSTPEGIEYYSYGGHQGLVIAAPGNARIKFHRLAGSSLLFGGSISVGDTNNIACGGTFHTEAINATLAPCSGTYGVTVLGTTGKICFTNYTYHNVRCIASTGEISTVAGAVQGLDDSTNLFFPATSFSEGDFNAAATYPNYTNMNGVTSFYLPSPIAAPLVNESFGALAFPLPLKAIDSSTLVVGEYTLGLIRKVKLP